MLEIIPKKNINSCVNIPGSKSYTHRLLIASALSDGVCIIKNGLESEDTSFTISALKQLGVKIERQNLDIIVLGSNGKFLPCEKPIYLGNSGTSMRFLTALVALGNGNYKLTGTDRMCQRPIGELLHGLNQIGILSTANNNCPPVEIFAPKEIKKIGGKMQLDCSLSSQYLSAVLLIAPCTQNGIKIEIINNLASKPYIDLTIDVLKKFEINLEKQNYEKFKVFGNQVYKAGTYEIEPDCSNASYFWASAAITKGKVKVKGISRNSYQGDLFFINCLEQMGCDIFEEPDGITVCGKELNGIEIDMANTPDIILSLAVVAAFAKGKTIIKNVKILKEKESDRLGAVISELSKMGINAYADNSGNNLIIHGGTPHGAEIETYNDHRVAMSFAVAGLAVPKIFIKNKSCVEKSFPNFWEVFEKF